MALCSDSCQSLVLRFDIKTRVKENVLEVLQQCCETFRSLWCQKWGEGGNLIPILRTSYSHWALSRESLPPAPDINSGQDVWDANKITSSAPAVMNCMVQMLQTLGAEMLNCANVYSGGAY